jgi:hypothetical protein
MLIAPVVCGVASGVAGAASGGSWHERLDGLVIGLFVAPLYTLLPLAVLGPILAVPLALWPSAAKSFPVIELRVQGLALAAILIATPVAALVTEAKSDSGPSEFLLLLSIIGFSLMMPRLVLSSLALGTFAARDNAP